MKRSEINLALETAIKFFRDMKFPLPSFAYFSPQQWQEKTDEYQEVVDNRLGWDVTDFGSGNFNETGRTIFTLRNGNTDMPEKYPKSYAQKVMHLREGQKSPVHYHKSKMEDIINHGGGIICIKVWLTNEKGELLDDAVEIVVSGSVKTFPAGEIIEIPPGESITLLPGMAHQFWAKKGAGDVLSVEISSVNDDENDNYWLGGSRRFPKVTEDEPQKYLLCNEYRGG